MLFYTYPQDLTQHIQQSDHVSRLKNVINQWKTKLREYSQHTAIPPLVDLLFGAEADAVVGGGVGAVFGGCALGFNVFGGAFGALGGAIAENALKQSIKEKTLEVNEELEKFYHFCHETAIKPEQVYAISLECARVSASTTEDVNDIIRKYQNPTVANAIEGFGFRLSSQIFPNDLTETSREDTRDIVRRLEQEHDQLMRYLEL